MSDGVISKIQLPDSTIYDVVDNTSGYMTGMTILSYGSSTWQDFIDAYSSNKVVYCRASSNSNPASGSQTRLAFMAYVNNATTPTEVEFQYYRSVSSHTASQQGDQVFVYKLNKTNGWSVTVREASVKVVAGTGLGGTYSNGTMTLTGPTKVSDLTNDSGYITTYTETDPTVPAWAKQSTKPSYTATEVGALPDDTFIPTNVSDLVNDEGYISSETDPTVPLWAKAPTKPSYSASEVGALPASTVIPSKTSDLTNDSGYITTETDPTVPAWAKAASKPTYTASEVGALPDTTVIPSATSDLTNDSGFITINDIPEEVAFAIYGQTTYTDIYAFATANKYIVVVDNGKLVPCIISLVGSTVVCSHFENGSEIIYVVTSEGWTSTSISYATTASLATVATSGSYNDLSDKPTIDATAIPTTNKISKFDTNAKMNSTDMTSVQVEDFVENLDVSGGGRNHGIPAGGSSGQVLAKNSGTDYDVTWVDAGGGAGSLITGSVELAANGWSNNTQTVTATGVTTSNVVLVNPAPVSYDEYVINNVRCTAQAANSLTFTCDFVPSEAITINLIIAGAIQMYNGGVE